ncbi:DNA repair protein RAD16 isoform X1 [Cannabis sativa]|uniref:DNA repair protein RAD16 isoform X1 n=1 Tax=Cannabis sativa TaxID=3483 RepID=UPI0029CA5A30|nr:DNA repair protein RAD16 isoform X1 [Cannabis sativa]
MELRSRSRSLKTKSDSANDGDGHEEDEIDIDNSDSSDDEIFVASSSDDEKISSDEDEEFHPYKRRKVGYNRGKTEIGLDKTIKKDEIKDEIDLALEGVVQKMKGKKKKSKKGKEEIEDEVDLALEGVVQKMKEKKKKSKKRDSKPVLMWNIWKNENEKWLDENFSKDLDLENQNEIVTEVAEAPADMVVDLLRYQKEWLAWALKQEGTPNRGGILADEMGMGKTIQAISLVLAKRELYRASGVTSDSSEGTSTDLPRIKSTLVICPVVAVNQWENEIDKFTSKGSTKVLVYHGANRGKVSKKFSDYDFVLTTYSIVEADYRRHTMPAKEKCPYCSKKFNEKRLTVHLKYYCGPNALKTEKQSKQQRKKFQAMPSTPKLDDKSSKGKKPAKQNEKEALAKEESALHAVNWERIILDEAHYIKSRRSNTARAVLSLESSYKWALSGTPLQNRVGELYSLLRFLQIVPYSFYFCKDCDCKVLDHSSSGDCSKCPHNSVRHFCWWNKFIATPIQTYVNQDPGKRAMMLLKHKILKKVVLRRTKQGRAADLALPPRIISLRRDVLDIKEQDYYESLYNESQAQFNTYIEAGTLMNNYAHIFDLLTRLRQAVDHPYLVVYSATAAIRNANKVEIDNEERVCGICHEPAENHVVTSCEHAFCKACLIDYAASLGQVSCPSCSKLLTVDLTSNADNGNHTSKTTIKGFRASSILNRVQLDNFQTSTKIEALREEIRFMIEKDGSAKGIVFSQFTSFLDLINYSLEKSGIKCVQLNGSMTMVARNVAIKKFIEDPECKIFLMSLKAGGVALNLTVASHVFMMDPWWNPAVERQAQDRIHRIGQYKPIRIVRFVIENTIEERILKLQEKKELVFEGTVGGCSAALGKLTEADMRFLFT